MKNKDEDKRGSGKCCFHIPLKVAAVIVSFVMILASAAATYDQLYLLDVHGPQVYKNASRVKNFLIVLSGLFAVCWLAYDDHGTRCRFSFSVLAQLFSLIFQAVALVYDEKSIIMG